MTYVIQRRPVFSAMNIYLNFIKVLLFETFLNVKCLGWCIKAITIKINKNNYIYKKYKQNCLLVWKQLYNYLIDNWNKIS